jgi:hypothetical protein
MLLALAKSKIDAPLPKIYALLGLKPAQARVPVLLRRMSLLRWFGVCGFGFFPGLELVPGTFAQARQRLRLGPFGKLDRRVSGGAQQRVQQRAIFGAQAFLFRAFPREFFFESARIPRPQSGP